MLNTLWQSLRGLSAPAEPAKNYRLRRSARAKRLRIAVYADHIEVVAPTAISAAHVEAFVARHWQWAQSKLAELAHRAVEAQSRLATETRLPFRGEHFPLTITERAGLRSSRVVFDRHFQVDVPAGLDAAQRRQLVKTKLEAWYRRQVADETQRLIQQHAHRHGLHPRRIAVRDQKTRWGSCGPRGDININWRLILAPPAALEYVVVHELCHLRHRNHAKPFWALVEDHLPHYQAQRRWLKEHGHTLMAVLAD